MLTTIPFINQSNMKRLQPHNVKHKRLNDFRTSAKF